MSYIDGAGIGAIFSPAGAAAEFNRLDTRIKSFAHQVFEYDRNLPDTNENKSQISMFRNAVADWTNNWREFYTNASRNWGLNIDQLERWESDYNAFVSRASDYGINTVTPKQPDKPSIGGIPWKTLMWAGLIGGGIFLGIRAIEAWKTPSPSLRQRLVGGRK